jgi:hypothetical protein
MERKSELLTYLQNLLQTNQITSTQISTPNNISINVGLPVFDVSRDLLVDNIRNFKYAEKVSFIGRQNQRYAIAIGYNPAMASLTTIDRTNKLIAYRLHYLGYDGYYLLNLYPDVQAQKVPKNMSLFPNYSNYVFNVINYRNFQLDTFIFWGSSVYVDKSLCLNINSLIQNVYTIGVNNGSNHRHPRRGVTAGTIFSTLRAKPITCSLGSRGYLI